MSEYARSPPPSLPPPGTDKTTAHTCLSEAVSLLTFLHPALKGFQGRLHLPRKNLRLHPEEEDLLCHGSVEIM